MPRAHFNARSRTGKLGEWIAAIYFLLQGYRIHARNLRLQNGEIDLIITRSNTLRIIEVRTTTTDYHDNVSNAAPPSKCRQVWRTTRAFLHQSGWEGSVHVDLFAVRLHKKHWPKMMWIKDIGEGQGLDSRRGSPGGLGTEICPFHSRSSSGINTQ